MKEINSAVFKIDDANAVSLHSLLPLVHPCFLPPPRADTGQASCISAVRTWNGNCHYWFPNVDCNWLNCYQTNKCSWKYWVVKAYLQLCAQLVQPIMLVGFCQRKYWHRRAGDSVSVSLRYCIMNSTLSLEFLSITRMSLQLSLEAKVRNDG